ncbi:hypothetical protein SAMN06265222_11031 [Neorhodopirellula lusitana]|uniref:Transposase zinc-binding domain-containing protein n=1 Tax=Neorhodopirellula lusitana TaxID=445327 RepID=A0ABY1QCJ3_9BACT|nr:hypothetical protein [Neorhodopirellula lusitana]SMP66706.1 hypothetical protein SAMN06265222_11031 [Neorhodopirellula lusitana]
MDKHLGSLLEEIHELERVVEQKIQQTKKNLPFEIQNGRAVFRPEVRKQHRALVRHALKMLRESSFLMIATAPVIYSLIIPISLLDLFVTVYQRVCFPVYQIPLVKRSEYVVIDRHLLSYLNVIEKFNCVYCGYSNGVLAYAREIASRTEQYWCPIKHAKHVKGCHKRQCMFCDFGDAEAFRSGYVELRSRFADLEAAEAIVPSD